LDVLDINKTAVILVADVLIIWKSFLMNEDGEFGSIRK